MALGRLGAREHAAVVRRLFEHDPAVRPRAAEALRAFEISLTTAEVFEYAAPAVVYIETRLTSGGRLGTGFRVGPGKHIVTNYHVVRHGPAITIETRRGGRHPARVVRTDPSLDLAVLQCDDLPEDVPALAFSIAAPRVGGKVMALGHPATLRGPEKWTLTEGIISRAEGSRLQTQTPVNPGNSGGTFLDEWGLVVGVAVAKALSPDKGDLEGINYAIPAALARRWLEKDP